MSIINQAAALAVEAHANQKRKFSGKPYICHPAEVAKYVENYTLEWGYNEDLIAAAWLHDVVEDCGIDIYEIQRHFGTVVSDYVFGLTNVYTKENFPDLNRAERKRREAERLSMEISGVRLIKGCDVLANLRDCHGADIGFLKRFREEKRELITYMYIPSLPLQNAIEAEL